MGVMVQAGNYSIPEAEVVGTEDHGDTVRPHNINNI